MKRFLTVTGILILLFPLGYLLFKTWELPPLKEASVPVLPADDIAALEKKAAEDPDFNNLLNLSAAYINKGMPGKSVPLLKKALRLSPGSAEAYNNLGLAYTMLQQYQKGIDACNAALKIDTSFRLAKNNLSWAMEEKKKVLEAIAAQERLPEKERTTETELERGLNYFRISEYDKSIEIWNRIAEKDMKDVRALNNIGTAFMMKEQYDDAIVLFNKVLETDPSNQLGKNNLAWALEEKGK